MVASMYRKGFKRRLAQFMRRFPSNAKSWAQATDEMPDVYAMMSEHGTRFPPVGRDNCKTPREWNTKYKTAIWKVFKQMSDHDLERVDHYFEWFGSRETPALASSGVRTPIGDGFGMLVSTATPEGERAYIEAQRAMRKRQS